MDICIVCNFLHKILEAYSTTYPSAKDICVKIWKSLEKLIFYNNWQKNVKIENTHILKDNFYNNCHIEFALSKKGE